MKKVCVYASYSKKDKEKECVRHLPEAELTEPSLRDLTESNTINTNLKTHCSPL